LIIHVQPIVIVVKVYLDVNKRLNNKKTNKS